MRISDFLDLHPTSEQLATLGAGYAAISPDDGQIYRDMVCDLYDLYYRCTDDEWQSVLDGYLWDQLPCYDSSSERWQLVARIEAKIRKRKISK